MIFGIIRIIILAVLFIGTVFIGSSMIDFELPDQGTLASRKLDLENEYIQISSLRLDRDLFVNPNFLKLEDKTVNIEPNYVKGRPNPFLPIGQDKEAPISPNLNQSLGDLLNFSDLNIQDGDLVQTQLLEQNSTSQTSQNAGEN